ncbi:uncharacterized protein LOC143028041 [Oratosquilla oratoria]|uniref:uncharacterized protein LOC143028041 n=1 Tax=Oratosquilla oratoria TaxID=337810 RepID=UPI003F761AC5
MSILNKPMLFLSISLFSCFHLSTSSSYSPYHSSSISSNSDESSSHPYASSDLMLDNTASSSEHRFASNRNNTINTNITLDSGFTTSPSGVQTDDVIRPLPYVHYSENVSYEAKDEPRTRSKRSRERWRSSKEERELLDLEEEKIQQSRTVKEVEDMKKKDEEAWEERPQRDRPPSSFVSSSSSSSSSPFSSSSDVQSPHDLLRRQRKELELFLWKQHSRGPRDERTRALGGKEDEEGDKEHMKDKEEKGRDRYKELLGRHTVLDLQGRWKDEDLLKEERGREDEVGKKDKVEKSIDDDYNVDDYASVSDDEDDYGIEEYLDAYQYEYEDEDEEEEDGDEKMGWEEEEEEGREEIRGIDGLKKEETAKDLGFDRINWAKSAFEEARRRPEHWQRETRKEKEEENNGGEKREEKRETTGKNPPHIIFIVVDDLGYNDVPWHNPEVEAPNLDQLSREGTVLENHYVLPVCTPSRSALLSGVYPFRYGRQMGMVRPLSPTGLNTSLVLLPQRLQELGYRTHLVGKDWRERLHDSRVKEEPEKTKTQGQRSGKVRRQEKTPRTSDRSKTHNNRGFMSWEALQSSSRSKRSPSFFPSSSSSSTSSSSSSSSSKNSKKFVHDRPEWKRKWTEKQMKEHLLWRTTKSKIEKLLREKESAKMVDGIQTRRNMEMSMRGGHDFRSNELPLSNVTGIYSTHLFSDRATQLINDHARFYRQPKHSFSPYGQERSKKHPFSNFHHFDKSDRDALQPDEHIEFLRKASGHWTSDRGFESRKPHLPEYSREETGQTFEESSIPPIFLMLSFQAVHSPLQVPPKYKKNLMHIPNRARRQFLGMVAAMDEAVGNVVDALKSNDMYENSVIVFTSDNGGSVSSGGNNFPLRGTKGGLFEGGTRGVAFIHSPLLKKRGQKYYGLMHAVDWYDTLLHVANGRHLSPDPSSNEEFKKASRYNSREFAKSRNHSWNKAHTRKQTTGHKRDQTKTSGRHPHKAHEKKKNKSDPKTSHMETKGKHSVWRRSRLDEDLANTKDIWERDSRPRENSFRNTFGNRYTDWDLRHRELSREDLYREPSKKNDHKNVKERKKENQGSEYNTQWPLRQKDKKRWIQSAEDLSEQDSKEYRGDEDWSPYDDDSALVKSQELPPEVWNAVNKYEEGIKQEEDKEKNIRTWRDIGVEDADKGKLWIWWKAFMAEEEGKEARVKREIRANMTNEAVEVEANHTLNKQEYVEDALNNEREEQEDYRIYQGLGVKNKERKNKKSRLDDTTASAKKKKEWRKRKVIKEASQEDEDIIDDDDDELVEREEELEEKEGTINEEKEEETDFEFEEEEEDQMEEEEEEMEEEEKEVIIYESEKYERQGKRSKRDTMELNDYLKEEADKQRGYQTDSYNMWSVISGNQPSPRSSFVYNVRKGPLKGAIRQRHWKLIVGTGGRLDGWIPPEDVRNDRGKLGPSWLSKQPHNKNILLFNLKSDPLETTDISEDHPEVVKRLRKLLRAYAKESQKPHAPADDARGHPSLFGGFFSTGWCEPIV